MDVGDLTIRSLRRDDRINSVNGVVTFVTGFPDSCSNMELKAAIPWGSMSKDAMRDQLLTIASSPESTRSSVCCQSSVAGNMLLM